jgi:hypothetical protein
VTHRYEMLILREYFAFMGVPLQIVADRDIFVISSCVASLASYVGVRHRINSRQVVIAQ